MLIDLLHFPDYSQILQKSTIQGDKIVLQYLDIKDIF